MLDPCNNAAKAKDDDGSVSVTDKLWDFTDIEKVVEERKQLKRKPMPLRVNGIGTTIAPIPPEGKEAFAMHWFSFLFVPLIPIGWQYIRGAGKRRYYILKKMTYSEMIKVVGLKKMLLIMGSGYIRIIAPPVIIFGSLFFFLFLCDRLDKHH